MVPPKQKPTAIPPKTRPGKSPLPKTLRYRLMQEYQRAKQEKTEHNRNSVQYAVDKVEDTGKRGARIVYEGGKRGGKKLIQKGRQKLKQRRDYVKNKAEVKALRESSSARAGSRSAVSQSKKQLAAKNKGRLLAKKKAAKAAKDAAKTLEYGAKTTQAAAKATTKAAKVAVQAIMKAAKAFAGLMMKIAAAAGPGLLVVILVAALLMIIASPLGIFFSGEDNTPDTTPISDVIRETAFEFNGKMLEVQNSYEWDELRVIYQGGRRNNWKEILAVFAVKTTMFDEDAMDVVTIDPTRAGLIKTIFWDMTEIQSYLETIEDYDEATDTTTYTYILHITIVSRTAMEQADRYGFTQEQKDILTELLGGEFDEYWAMLIGGAGDLGPGTPVIGSGEYIWPSDSSDRVTSLFGNREHPVTGQADDHYGIDIGAGAGTNVLAADAGTVTISQWHWSYGNYIVINHGDGRSTLYAHLSVAYSYAGLVVNQGDIIGLVGDTGVVDGAHLHFETKIHGVRVDPLNYFNNYVIV